MREDEHRVGIAFNPSNDDRVDQIKRKVSVLIDMIDQIGGLPVPESVSGSQAVQVMRIKALAYAEIERKA